MMSSELWFDKQINDNSKIVNVYQSVIKFIIGVGSNPV